MSTPEGGLSRLLLITMPNCVNCNNLLPRTVDRCPVCGADSVLHGGTDAEAAPPAPAWRPASPAAAAPEDSALSPDDFLAEFLGDDAPPPPPSTADDSPFPAPPAETPTVPHPPAEAPAEEALPWSPVADVEVPAAHFAEPDPSPFYEAPAFPASHEASPWAGTDAEPAPPAYQFQPQPVEAEPMPVSEPAPRAWDEPAASFPAEASPFDAPPPEEPALSPRAWDAPALAPEPEPPARAWDAPEHSTFEHGTLEHGTPDYGTLEHGTPDYGTLEHGTTEHPAPEPAPAARAWDTPAPETDAFQPQPRAWDLEQPATPEPPAVDQEPAGFEPFQPFDSFEVSGEPAPAAEVGSPTPAHDPVPPVAAPSFETVGETPIFDPHALQTDFGSPPPAVPDPAIPASLVPAPIQGHGAISPPPDAPPPQGAPVSVARETPDSLVPRSVVATSSRIEGNFRRGPSGRHGIAIAAAAVTSVAAMAFGWTVGWSGASTSIEMIAVEDSAPADGDPEDPLAATDDELEAAADSTTTSEPAAVTSDGAIDGIVSLRLDDCGVTGSTIGVLVDADIVLALRSQVLLDATPTVVLTDGTTVAGEVLDWSRFDDLAVIRTAEPIAGAIEWGTTGAIRTDSVLSGMVGDPTVEPVWDDVVVTDYDRSTGLVTAFEFEESNLAPGAPIRKENGQLAGLTDRTGSAARASQLLRPQMVDLMSDPEFPSSECPVPETTLPPGGETTDPTTESTTEG